MCHQLLSISYWSNSEYWFQKRTQDDIRRSLLCKSAFGVGMCKSRLGLDLLYLLCIRTLHYISNKQWWTDLGMLEAPFDHTSVTYVLFLEKDKTWIPLKTPCLRNKVYTVLHLILSAVCHSQIHFFIITPPPIQDHNYQTWTFLNY